MKAAGQIGEFGKKGLTHSDGIRGVIHVYPPRPSSSVEDADDTPSGLGAVQYMHPAVRHSSPETSFVHSASSIQNATVKSKCITHSNLRCTPPQCLCHETKQVIPSDW